MKKIMLYGTGKLASIFMKEFRGQYEIVGFIETNKTNDKAFGKWDIYSLDEIDYKNDIQYYMANTYIDTLLNLLDKGIPKENITILSWKMFNNYVTRNNGIGDIYVDVSIAEKFQNIDNPRVRKKREEFVLTRRMCYDMVKFGEVNRQDFRLFIDDMDVIRNDDYARRGTLTLIADEIKKRQVVGDVAELGVYMGGFAQYINRLFPDRLFYLIDTFEGFDEEDLHYDKSLGYDQTVKYFTEENLCLNKDIDAVLRLMLTPEKCRVVKGRFPESLLEEMYEKKFGFVSLDCDLYLPMYEGLVFFYPRLSSGGYIMIHDYNNIPGVKKAVYDYEEKYGMIAKVPITDTQGSLVITKK